MKRITSVFLYVLFIVSCNPNDRDTQPGNNTSSSVDYLSEEQLQVLENVGIDTITRFSDLLFPDGTKMIDWERINDPNYTHTFGTRNNPASDKKQLFINTMSHAGDSLTNRASFRSILNQGNGIAYVYGSRSLKERAVWNPQDPRQGKPALCQTPLYGLDCNGLIYLMATSSNLKLPAGNTATYLKVETWNEAFKNSEEFIGLQMTDLSLPWSQVEAGDIIVSTGKHNHIGMVYENGKSKGLIHATGSPDSTCAANSNPRRGPNKTQDLAKWVQNLFTTNFHVLRVVQNGKPGLSTLEVSQVNDTSAVSGGNITNDGGSTITERGVCWSTSPNPTILDSKIKDTTGKGRFVSKLTGLIKGKEYFVRAYATNNGGTAYGQEVRIMPTSGTIIKIGRISYDSIPASNTMSLNFIVNNGVISGTAQTPFYPNGVIGQVTGSINGSSMRLKITLNDNNQLCVIYPDGTTRINYIQNWDITGITDSNLSFFTATFKLLQTSQQGTGNPCKPGPVAERNLTGRFVW